MGEHHFGRRPSALLGLALVLGAALVVASPLGAVSRHEHNSYTVTPLVSDQPGMAAHTDGNLVNAWGLTAGPTTPWWVSDNGTDKSTLYNGDGTPRALVVDVAGGPTGTAFNPTAGFVLPTGGKALFLFDGEDGVIRGWNGAQGTTAVVVKDRSNRRCDLQGPDGRRHAGRAAAVRGRLPQRADRRPGRELRPETRRFPGSVPPTALRAVQRPGDRRPRVRGVCEAGREGRG